MNSFAADWLARREPYDRRARNAKVLDAVVTSLQRASVLGILDLGCGTGAMLRELAPRFVAPQNWRLVDNDFNLMARAAAAPDVSSAITVTAMPLDLSRDLEAALDGSFDLVVTSALLDLVSAAWLERLTVEIAARDLPFYAALSYEGRVEFAPPDPFDGAIIAALNTHQRTDKGFGPALGPDAASFAIARLRSLGCAVVHGPSDWAMAPDDADMQFALLDGWAGTACAAGASRTDAMDWLSRRRDLVLTRQSSIRVGHVDFWARQIAIR
jgi:SAM-dependent methyltransferase